MKPENVLIDSCGYAKIADFGLSKPGISNQSKTYSLCGTAEYLSPEAIINEGYGQTVDWWSLGCFIYELVTGFPPFSGNTKEELKKKILNEQPKITNAYSPEFRDIISKLLTKDPKKRLGLNGS